MGNGKWEMGNDRKLRRDAARVLGRMQGFIATTARSRWDQRSMASHGGHAW